MTVTDTARRLGAVKCADDPYPYKHSHGVFAVRFFDRDGAEVGYWIPDRGDDQFHAFTTPRVWDDCFLTDLENWRDL